MTAGSLTKIPYERGTAKPSTIIDFNLVMIRTSTRDEMEERC